MKLNVGRARVEPILEILGGIAISVVIFSGAWRLGKVDFSVGDFAGFITAMPLMVQPARGLGSFNSSRQIFIFFLFEIDFSIILILSLIFSISKFFLRGF